MRDEGASIALRESPLEELAHEQGIPLPVIIEPAVEGGYAVTCPALPGVVTEGDTLEEAREMAQDAIRGYLESLLADGLEPPAERRELEEPIKEIVEVFVEAA